MMRRSRALPNVPHLVGLLLTLLVAVTSCSTDPGSLDAGASPTSATRGTAAPPGTAPGTTGTTAPTTTTEPPTTTTEAPPPTTTTLAVPTTPAPTVPRTTMVYRPTLPPTTPAPTEPPPTEPGPDTGAPPPLPAGDNRVWVEGDSVLLGVETSLPGALPGWDVTMDTVGSRRLSQALPVLQANRARIGRVAVIMLGNNYFPEGGLTFGQQIDRAMEILDGTDRVIWVTLAEKLAGRAELNDEIRAAAGRWPTIVIAEWTPIVMGNPGYATSDGLHLSGSGRAAMTQLLVETIGPAPG